MHMVRYGLVILILLLGVLPVLAQDDTPPTPISVDEAQAILQQAQKAAEDADKAMDMAFNLLGLFEYIGGAVAMVLGVVVPFVALVAGVLGFARLNSAQNELREARERFEKDIKERQTEIADYFERSRVQAEMERIAFEETINQQKKQSANASFALALLPLAERQYLAQDYQGAIETYERALVLYPNNPIIHYRLGYVYTHSGDLEKAQKSLEKALEIDPTFYQAVAALGYVYRRIGDAIKDPARIAERDEIYDKSETLFLQALSKQSHAVDEDKESWWGALGGLYRRRGQILQAISAYEQAAKATPYSSYPFSNLAILYLQLGDKQKTIEIYKRVERLARAETTAEIDNYWAYADWVVALVAQGKFNEIERENLVDMAISIAPLDSPYTLEMLVDTLTRLGALLTEYKPQIEKYCAQIQVAINKRKSLHQ